MSWVQDLAGFARQLLTLEYRVKSNVEEIKGLREDLKALTEFTQKVAYAVKRNEERRVNHQSVLTRDLKIELLELERRLSGREVALHVVEGGQNRLPESRDDSQG